MRRGAGKQVRVGSAALLCFSAAFSTWQMGIVYFSGTALSLFGRTPIEVNQSFMLAVLAAGYLVSITAICLVPRTMVLVQRAVFSVALAATVAVLLPLAAPVVTAAFYVASFCCSFSIGGMACIAAYLFTVETAWRDGIVSMVFSGLCIALLQNDFVRPNLSVFMVCSLVLLSALMVFQFMLPPRIEAPFATRDSGHRRPSIPYAGIFLMVLFPTFLLLMATSIAETVPHGVSLMFLSAAVLAVVLHLIRTRYRSHSIRAYGAFFMMTPLGFVCTIAAGHVPALGMVACLFFGFSVVLSNMYSFFLASAFALYPSRFIAAQGTALGLALATIHSGILELFRGNIDALCLVYLVLSITLMVVYHLLEPHFMYNWDKNMEQDDDLPSPIPDGGESRRPTPAATFSVLDALSIQERNLAQLILSGYSESQIAKEMNITLNTQKSYRKSLYTKLDIHSKRELFQLVQD